MEQESILKHLQHICSEVTGIEEGEFRPHVTLREDLGVSSMEFAEVIGKIEQQFKVVPPKDRLLALSTMQDLVDLLEEEL